MIKKTGIAVSAVVNLVLVAAVTWLALGGFANLAKRFIVEPHYARSVSQFEDLSTGLGETVFLGDSLTEFGMWGELFPDAPVRTRGIFGDDTAGVLGRLDQVTAGKPRQVFLMIGTNDLSYGSTQEEIVSNVRKIVSTIKSDSAGTDIFVQSVLPRGGDYRERVESLNHKLHLATAGDATWIDLYPHFLAEDGSIADRYSNDELHLFGDGYLLWRDLIKRHVIGHTTEGGAAR